MLFILFILGRYYFPRWMLFLNNYYPSSSHWLLQLFRQVQLKLVLNDFSFTTRWKIIFIYVKTFGIFKLFTPDCNRSPNNILNLFEIKGKDYFIFESLLELWMPLTYRFNRVFHVNFYWDNWLVKIINYCSS